MPRDNKNTPSSTSDMCLYLLAFFLPPAAVALKRGCGADFWINLLLFILAWLPGVIHAWYIIAKYPDNEPRVASVPSATTPYHQHAQQTNYGAVPQQNTYAPPPHAPGASVPAPAYEAAHPAGAYQAPVKN